MLPKLNPKFKNDCAKLNPDHLLSHIAYAQRYRIPRNLIHIHRNWQMIVGKLDAHINTSTNMFCTFARNMLKYVLYRTENANG